MCVCVYVRVCVRVHVSTHCFGTVVPRVGLRFCGQQPGSRYQRRPALLTPAHGRWLQGDDFDVARGVGTGLQCSWWASHRAWHNQGDTCQQPASLWQQWEQLSSRAAHEPPTSQHEGTRTPTRICQPAPCPLSNARPPSPARRVSTPRPADQQPDLVPRGVARVRLLVKPRKLQNVQSERQLPIQGGGRRRIGAGAGSQAVLAPLEDPPACA
jgi:hypothetical protein